MQSLQKESRLFLQNELPVLTLVNHFIYVVVLTHPFSLGYKRQPSVRGGEKDGDVRAPPGALLRSGRLKGKARENVSTSTGKGDHLDSFLLKGPFPCCFGPGFCVSPCSCGPGFSSCNVVAVKSCRRNPCLVRKHVYKAKFKVGIWQLPCGWDSSWSQIGFLFVQNCSLC